MDGEPLMDSERIGDVKKALFKAPAVADLDRRLDQMADTRK
jgi:hypothetical protein